MGDTYFYFFAHCRVSLWKWDDGALSGTNIWYKIGWCMRHVIQYSRFGLFGVLAAIWDACVRSMRMAILRLRHSSMTYCPNLPVKLLIFSIPSNPATIFHRITTVVYYKTAINSPLHTIRACLIINVTVRAVSRRADLFHIVDIFLHLSYKQARYCIC